jgi:hypothetical protein
MIRSKLGRGDSKGPAVYYEESIKESPYKLYEVPSFGSRQQIYDDVTLGDKLDGEEVDPQYNLLSSQIPETITNLLSFDKC